MATINIGCTPCYADWISCGVDGIVVYGTLLPETEYTWILTTPQEFKYQGDITTDADGYFVIDTSTLPGGLFNPYAGVFTLEVQTSNCNPATWNDSAYCDPYDCISFEAKNGNAEKNTLGCPCLADEPGDCSPTIVTFTDVATLDIPYTAAMLEDYGNVPTVQVWIYDGLGRLLNMAITASLDAVPPTQISLDFGGVASGLIVIR